MLEYSLVLVTGFCIVGFGLGNLLGLAVAQRLYSPCSACGSITSPRRHRVGNAEETRCVDGDGCRARLSSRRH